jgi:hypothetical protein
MKKARIIKKKLSSQSKENKTAPGYPVYPPDDDIYTKYKEEKELDPEMKTRKPNDAPGKRNEKDFNDDMTGGDLDVPGSELDEEQDNIGNDDEENDYYSLGGDDHDDLEEDKGD